MIESGLIIDGKKTLPAKISPDRITGKNSVVKITIFEGRNLQIKKMFASINHPVVKLTRIKIGNLSIKNLSPGNYRFLKKSEIEYFSMEK